MKHKVVLVPFPFDDLSTSKVRPAVCLTEPIGQHKHVILGFITSRVPYQTWQTYTDIELVTWYKQIRRFARDFERLEPLLRDRYPTDL